MVNSSSPEIYGSDFKCAIMQLIVMTDILSIASGITLRWIPQDFSNNKSVLVEVMAWCREATSHYLTQYWSSPILPYGITKGE